MERRNLTPHKLIRHPVTCAACTTRLARPGLSGMPPLIVGFTARGFQVFCTGCKNNVLHIDHQGADLPITTEPDGVLPEPSDEAHKFEGRLLPSPTMTDTPTELPWRGLVLRPDPPHETTLRAGRWAVSPSDGVWVATWRHEASSFRSARDAPLEALDALARYLDERPVEDGRPVRALLRADLDALSPVVEGRKPIVWRGVTLAPRGPGVWVTADRLWKLTHTPGGRWVAYLQLDLELFIVECHDTPDGALDSLAKNATAVADKLAGALRQASVPS